jgi:hypothetical protein
MKTNIYFLSYLAQFFLEWEIFHANIIEKIKNTNILSVNIFLRKSYHLWNNVEKFYRAWQHTCGNMAHAHCILDT